MIDRWRLDPHQRVTNKEAACLHLVSFPSVLPLPRGVSPYHEPPREHPEGEAMPLSLSPRARPQKYLTSEGGALRRGRLIYLQAAVSALSRRHALQEALPRFLRIASYSS